MTPLNMSQRFAPSPDALESRVGDETVLLHLGNSAYYGLDPVGTRIWELIKAGHDLAGVKAQMLAEYAVDDAVMTADMQRFVGDLLANGILCES
jgi:hypothetical protein